MSTDGTEPETNQSAEPLEGPLYPVREGPYLDAMSAPREEQEAPSQPAAAAIEMERIRRQLQAAGPSELADLPNLQNVPLDDAPDGPALNTAVDMYNEFEWPRPHFLDPGMTRAQMDDIISHFSRHGTESTPPDTPNPFAQPATRLYSSPVQQRWRDMLLQHLTTMLSVPAITVQMLSALHRDIQEILLDAVPLDHATPYPAPAEAATEPPRAPVTAPPTTTRPPRGRVEEPCRLQADIELVGAAQQSWHERGRPQVAELFSRISILDAPPALRAPMGSMSSRVRSRLRSARNTMIAVYRENELCDHEPPIPGPFVLLEHLHSYGCRTTIDTSLLGALERIALGDFRALGGGDRRGYPGTPGNAQPSLAALFGAVENYRIRDRAQMSLRERDHIDNAIRVAVSSARRGRRLMRDLLGALAAASNGDWQLFDGSVCDVPSGSAPTPVPEPARQLRGIRLRDRSTEEPAE